MQDVVPVCGGQSEIWGLPVRLILDRRRVCRLVMFAQLEGNEPAQQWYHAGMSVPNFLHTEHFSTDTYCGFSI